MSKKIARSAVWLLLSNRGKTDTIFDTEDPRIPPDGAEMSKRNSGSKNSSARFDATTFLKTAAKGRVISAHPAKDIIFAQGDDADSVS
jgi:hypothetical protein